MKIDIYVIWICLDSLEFEFILYFRYYYIFQN